jgi:hypothetical protein
MFPPSPRLRCGICGSEPASTCMFPVFGQEDSHPDLIPRSAGGDGTVMIGSRFLRGSGKSTCRAERSVWCADGVVLSMARDGSIVFQADNSGTSTIRFAWAAGRGNSFANVACLRCLPSLGRPPELPCRYVEEPYPMSRPDARHLVRPVLR